MLRKIHHNPEGYETPYGLYALFVLFCLASSLIGYAIGTAVGRSLYDAKPVVDKLVGL